MKVNRFANRRALLGAAALALIGALATGCGTSVSAAGAGGTSGGSASGGSNSGGNNPGQGIGEVGGTALAAVQTAASQSSRYQSVQVNDSMSMGSLGTISMRGGVNYGGKSAGAAFTVTMSGGMLSQAMGGAGSTKMIMTGNALYMYQPAQAAANGGKPWTRTSLSGAGGMSMGQVFQQQDPTAAVKYLIAANNLTKVGPETVNGVATTHYRGTVDFATLANNPTLIKMYGKQAVRQLTQLGISQGLDKEAIDIWLQADNLPAKEVVSFDMQIVGPVTNTMYLTNWGEPVDLTPPAANQVAVGQSLGSLGSLGG